MISFDSRRCFDILTCSCHLLQHLRLVVMASALMGSSAWFWYETSCQVETKASAAFTKRLNEVVDSVSVLGAAVELPVGKAKRKYVVHEWGGDEFEWTLRLHHYTRSFPDIVCVLRDLPNATGVKKMASKTTAARPPRNKAQHATKPKITRKKPSSMKPEAAATTTPKKLMRNGQSSEELFTNADD